MEVIFGGRGRLQNGSPNDCDFTMKLCLIVFCAAFFYISRRRRPPDVVEVFSRRAAHTQRGEWVGGSIKWGQPSFGDRSNEMHCLLVLFGFFVGRGMYGLRAWNKVYTVSKI